MSIPFLAKYDTGGQKPKNQCYLATPNLATYIGYFIRFSVSLCLNRKP